MTGKITDLFVIIFPRTVLRVSSYPGGRRKGPWISLYIIISLWKTALVLDKGWRHLFQQVSTPAPPSLVYIASPVDDEPLSFQRWSNTRVVAGPS
jgi:hypothetical protein